MPSFRPRLFLLILGLAAFTLVYLTVGLRWHTYRARASLYARQETDHAFNAGHYTRAARNPGFDEEAPQRALKYRRLADMHAKAAEECGKLREFYEQAW